MRKKLLLFLSIIALTIPLTVSKAATGSVTCGSDSYRIVRTGWAYLENTLGHYNMSLYDSYNQDGTLAGYTYCINAGLASPKNKTQQCSRRIDPSSSANGLGMQAYDVAIQKAYEILLEEGLISSNEESRVIGELLFRFLSFKYGRSDAEQSIGRSTAKAVEMFRLHNLDKWRDPRATRAIEIFNRATAIGDKILAGTSYEELVKTGDIWAPDYEATGTTMTPELINQFKIVGDDMVYFMFEIRANNPPQETYWDMFTVSCANGYQCSIVKPGETTVSTEGKVIVRVNPNSGNGSGEYGVTLHSNYYDRRSAAANIIETAGPSSGFQHMLIITPGNPTIKMNNTTDNGSSSGGRPSGGDSIHPNIDICVCDPATGEFKDSKTKNTCNVKTSADKCEDFKKTYKCSIPADNPNCESRKCLKEPNTNKCYGPDGKEISCDKYDELCDYKCSDTYDNYCPGDGTTPSKDGKIKTSCSEAIWTRICLCEKDPNNPKCANCNAAVNMVGDCADLTTGNVETEYTGAISDVNEKDNTGAYIAACRTKDADKDPIKVCVAHDLAIDQAGNNYKSTNSCDETNTQTLLNNPYCSVYCKEQYNFTTPTAQLVSSGGYFTVYTKISGKRTCYVAGSDNKGESTPINYVQFKKDFDLAQKEVIDAWNEYNHWRTGYEDGDHSRIDEDSEWCGSDDDQYEVTDSKTQYYYTWVYTKYDINGNAGTAIHPYETNGYAYATCSGPEGVEGVSQLSRFKNNMDAAKKVLETKIANLEKIITYYNSCTKPMVSCTK